MVLIQFKVTVNPVTDEPSIEINEVFVKEDDTVKLEIIPFSVDKDGSETTTEVIIDKIPEGAVLE